MALISLNNLERFFNNLKTYISNALNSKVDSNNLKTINNNSLVGTGNITITASSVDWDNVNNKPNTFTPSTHTHAASDITSGLATVATSGSYNDLSNKPTIPTVNNATLKIQKNGTDVKTFTANASSDVTCNITVPTKVSELTNDSGFLTSHQDLSGYVPRSGGAVLSGTLLGRVNNTGVYAVCGGRDSNNGGNILLYGNAHKSTYYQGAVTIYALTSGSTYSAMEMYPSGTWIWSGTACQITSDQRLKQQISNIDDKLLDAWEDVELCQFKYNDAVDQKKDKARLHTGFVVQQIDSACKSHGVDISEYGLYCHEEYPEETEEVEVEQADGTKTKERKVIREASEHYSLRYTETLVVECAYLRRENKRLNDRLTTLEELFKQYITK